MGEQSRAEFEKRLLRFVAENPDFREKVKKDPKGAMGEFLGAVLPDDLNIVVHEEDRTTLHLVLPPRDEELSAAEMAGVSGGVCWSDSCEMFVNI